MARTPPRTPPIVNARLARRDGENERAHRAFLLWAMQAEGARNMRATARAVTASDNAVRKWKVAWEWESRVEDPTSDTQAATMFAQLYHVKTGGAEVLIVADTMAFEYVGPATEDVSVVGRAVDAHIENDARIRQSDDEIRRQRLETVLDATETQLLVELAKPEKERTIQVKLSDLPHVIRGRAYLNATRAPTGTTKASAGEDRARSYRVEKAVADGVDPLYALKAESDEIALIIETMINHEEASNVVAFPSRSRSSKSGPG